MTRHARDCLTDRLRQRAARNSALARLLRESADEIDRLRSGSPTARDALAALREFAEPWDAYALQAWIERWERRAAAQRRAAP